MITTRKRFGIVSSRRSLLPALLFVAAASWSLAGGGAIAALCLVPAGLALEAARGKDAPGGDA
jgi:hypothetical protein